MAMAVMRVGSETSGCQDRLAPGDREGVEEGMLGGECPWSTGWAAARGSGGDNPPRGRMPAAPSPPGHCPQGAVGWPWAPS